MDTLQRGLTEATGGFASTLLSGLWRAGVGGIFFAALVWSVCRVIPRIPATTRFWLWWMVSAKLLLSLLLSLSAPALPVVSPFVLHLPSQHPAAAPAFFVARLVVQPTRLLDGSVPQSSVSSGKSGSERATTSVPATGAITSGQEAAATEPIPGTENASRTGVTDTHRPVSLWQVAALIMSLLWCAGFLLRLMGIAKGVTAAGVLRRQSVPVPEWIQQEANTAVRLLRMHCTPRILMNAATSSPFLTGFFRSTIVLPDPDRTRLNPSELRMALAHELTHLRRGDLWLSLVPALSEAVFFFLPVARWSARECDVCREEICDSAAVTSLGNSLLADYGQLLLKVTLASQSSHQPALQMSMAVTVSPAFVQLRRRLNSLKDSVRYPVSPARRRAATLLLAVCLPGVLPWHLRALPRALNTSETLLGGTSEEMPQYSVLDLGTLGGKFSDAYSIGEDGAIVGTANVYPQGGRGHAFLWRPGSDPAQSGTMADLCEGSIYRHSLAYSINAKGQIAAAAFNNPLKPNAFLWTNQNQRRYLGTLPGFRFSRATGINDDGKVVGAAIEPEIDRRGATRMRAFAWHNGKMADLGTLGGDFSAAVAISDSGYIVGKSDVGIGGGGMTHAALWKTESGQPLDIGTLPGGGNSAASAVNEQGAVVGYSESLEAPRRAFLYEDGSLQDLGALPFPDAGMVPVSRADGINDAGWIVGYSSAVPTYSRNLARADVYGSRAVVWLPQKQDKSSRRLIDLNDCVSTSGHWVLESARAINNRGEIAGVGRIDGKRHAFLLRPLSTSPVNTEH